MDFLKQHKAAVAGALTAALILGGLAWAQQEVLLVGTDSTSTTRAVAVNSSGQLIVASAGTSGSYPASCTVTQTAVNVVTTAGGTATPASQTASRAYVNICNSKVNTAGLIKCRADGTAPVYASGAGVVLDIGDCVSFAVPDTVTPLCISSTGTVVTETTECVLR